MAHIGKLYPRYNPARVMNCDPGPNPGLPTEFQWQCDDWFGPVGSGAPNGSRGMLPVYPPYPPANQNYEQILTGILGPPFLFRLIFKWLMPADMLVCALEIRYGGVLQMNSGDANVDGSHFETTFSFVRSDGQPPSSNHIAILPGAQVYIGNFMSIKARKWSDLPPKPPHSTPF